MSFNFSFGAPSTNPTPSTFTFGPGAAATPSTPASTPAFSFTAPTMGGASTATPSTPAPSTTPAFSFSTPGITPLSTPVSAPAFSFTTPASTPAPATTAFPSTATAPTFSFSTPALTTAPAATPAFSFATPSTTPATPAFSFATPSTTAPAAPLFASQAIPPPKEVLTPQQAIEALAASYQPNHPYCRFRHMLYNVVPAGEASKYSKPSDTDERLWNQALKDNPDPSRLVPIQVTGFSDLKKRLEDQQSMAKNHETALSEIKKFLEQLQQRHELSTSTKIEQYKKTHLELSHRVLRIMKKIEITQNKGNSLTMNEEHFRNKLVSLQNELNKPTQFKGKLNELSSLIRLQEEMFPSYLSSESQDILDDGSVDQIFKFLSEQQTGLTHLTDIVKKDSKDLQYIIDNTNNSIQQQQYSYNYQ